MIKVIPETRLAVIAVKGTKWSSLGMAV